MTTTNYKKFLQFMLANSPKKDAISRQWVEEKVEIIRPLFDITDAFRFGAEKNLNPDRVASAIALAAGKTVENLLTISISDPHPLEGWVAESWFAVGLHYDLQGKLYGSDPLLRTLSAALNDNLWHHLRNSLVVSLWDGLRHNLDWGSTLHSESVGLVVTIGHTLLNNFHESTFLFIGSILTENAEMVDRLTPQMRELTSGFPLMGKQVNEPTTGFVFVA
ncbi:MAG: hypothetical protein AAB467_04395 [Patescibacteria group bacterium]